ncbi:hypothetical protein [Dickeya undicola]|uniref:YbjN domain-containing protein n=1 Tax=Dickeya undicola TaxID=1577887 RepID=A0A3N0G0S5_9GAMM|nr:hypothetical protein [Dickeya undicola]RNM05802.1 hypothetical protein EF878_11195 [Dickeya undicola]
MNPTTKNKTILRENTALVEKIIQSKDEKHIKEKVRGDHILLINFKEENVGYVKLVIEVNGIMSYMYLSFYNVNEEKDENGLDSKNIYKICNEVNKALSPSKLVVNDDRVYALSSVALNITTLKKTEILDILESFKNATINSVSTFRKLMEKGGV